MKSSSANYESFKRLDPASKLLPEFQILDPDSSKQRNENQVSESKHVKKSIEEKDLRRFWVRDDSSKICYQCELSFSLLKRRHHCRGCGLIFCGSCTPFTVNGKRFGYNSTVRVCESCMKIATTYDAKAERLRSVRHACFAMKYDAWGNGKSTERVASCLEIIDKATSEVIRTNLNHIHANLSEDTRNTWNELLQKLCTRCCADLILRPDLHDSIDPTDYVTVLGVSGGKPSDTLFTNGVIVPANVIHRKMENSIDDPVLMLVEGNIRYYRDPGHLASLDTLVDQEEEWIKLVVKKLETFGVNLLVLGGGISVVGYEMLIDAGISVVQYMSRLALGRLSRATGCAILPSLGHFDMDNPQLGTCAKWYIAHLDRLKEFETSATSVEKGQVQIMVFGDCPAHVGSSVCLRGADEAILHSMGAILNDIIIKRFNLMAKMQLVLDTATDTEEYTKPFSGVDEDPGVKNTLQHSSSSLNQLCTGIVELMTASTLQVTRVWLDGTMPTCNPKNATIHFNYEMDQSLHQFLFKFGFLQRMIWPGVKSPIYWLDSNHRLVFMYHRICVAVSAGKMDSLGQKHLPCVLFNDRFPTPPSSYPSREDAVSMWYEYCHSNATSENETQTTTAKPLSYRAMQISFGKFLQQLLHTEGTPFQPLPLLFNPKSPEQPEQRVRNVFLAWKDSYTKFEIISIGSFKLLPTHAMQLEPIIIKSLRSIQLSEFEDFAHATIESILESKQFQGYSLQQLDGCAAKDYLERLKDKTHSIVQQLRAQSWNQHNFLLHISNLQVWFVDNLREMQSQLMAVTRDRATVANPLVGDLNADKESNQNPRSDALESSPNAPPASETPGLLSYIGIQAPEVLEQTSTPSSERDDTGDGYKPETVRDVVEPLPLPRSLCWVFDGLHQVPWMGSGVLVRQDEVSSWIAQAISSRTTWIAVLKAFLSIREDIAPNTQLAKENFEKGFKSPALQVGPDRPADMASSEGKLPLSEENSPIGVENSSETAGPCAVVEDTVENETSLFSPKNVKDTTERHGATGSTTEHMQPISENEECIVAPEDTLDTQFSSPIFADFGSHSESLVQNDASLHQLIRDVNAKLRTQSWGSILVGDFSPVNVEHKFQMKFGDSVGNQSQDAKLRVEVRYALRFAALRQLIWEHTCDTQKGTKSFIDANHSYVNSLLRCLSWETSGGQTNAHFFKTLDRKYVMKTVKQEELDSFDRFSNQYFAYLSGSLSAGRTSLLSKIVGIYTVHFATSSSAKSSIPSKRHVLVMENALWGVETSEESPSGSNGTTEKASSSVDLNKHVQTFDLKGNQRNRYVANPKAGQVLLDNNFFEWRKGIPIALQKQDHETFTDAINQDAQFLSKVGVVDYSMLLQVDAKNEKVYVGIIDYLQLYNYKKMIESKVKKAGMIAGQLEPTVIGPLKYSERFVGRFRQYFVATSK